VRWPSLVKGFIFNTKTQQARSLQFGAAIAIHSAEPNRLNSKLGDQDHGKLKAGEEEQQAGRQETREENHSELG
jgi:hypothetical protein